MKNTGNVLNIFVNKLVQKSGRILTREDLLDIWLLSGWSRSRLAYALQQAKYAGHISLLMNGIFFVRNSLDNPDSLYWNIVAVLTRKYSPAGAIVSWEKSMEFYLRNFSIPDILILYTRDTTKRIRLKNGREVHFRTLKSGEKMGSKNMFRFLMSHSLVWNIDWAELLFLDYDASLLDAATVRIHEAGISEVLFEKFLRQYEKRLSRENLGSLVSYRYIRAANRLRSFAKQHDFNILYNMLIDIIKREWGWCYLNL